MTESFTRLEFENVLSEIAKDLGVIVEYYGVVDFEYQYRLRVRDWLWIRVRSSVLSDTRRAADCGTNSIRVTLVDVDDEPIANKLRHHVTRVTGWQTRLKRIVADTLAFAGDIRACCGQAERKYKARSNGRWFLKCLECGRFRWASEEEVK